MAGVKGPFRYEPSGDSDGETFGTDHFVLDADGDEIACAPNEATGKVLGAAFDTLAACEDALRVINSHTAEPIPAGVYNRLARVLSDAIAKAR